MVTQGQTPYQLVIHTDTAQAQQALRGLADSMNEVQDNAQEGTGEVQNLTSSSNGLNLSFLKSFLGASLLAGGIALATGELKKGFLAGFTGAESFRKLADAWDDLLVSFSKAIDLPEILSGLENTIDNAASRLNAFTTAAPELLDDLGEVRSPKDLQQALGQFNRTLNQEDERYQPNQFDGVLRLQPGYNPFTPEQIAEDREKHPDRYLAPLANESKPYNDPVSFMYQAPASQVSPVAPLPPIQQNEPRSAPLTINVTTTGNGESEQSLKSQILELLRIPEVRDALRIR